MKLNLANRITVIRILLIFPFIICLLRMNQPQYGDTFRHIATVIFLAMCISDALDGYMARVKKQVTRLGSFLDPMADKLLMTTACVLLAHKNIAIPGFVLPKEVAVLIIGKDILLLLGFTVLYMMTAKVHIVPNPIGKFAAFLQLSMVAAILIAPEMSNITPNWINVCRTLWVTAAATAVTAMMIYLRNGKQFVEQHETQSSK
ncbi:MAG: CDP-alcohol phosphatidyltransferase family protein [Anaerohalosphaera sp.]|nr:CDP-alcohol phosphatidyltransferase family protein [Anaerohalosphaera sp.]